MHQAFEVHMLNEVGKRKAQQIAQLFDTLLTQLEEVVGKDGREMAIVRTKLEESCFFSKKAMACQPQNSSHDIDGNK